MSTFTSFSRVENESLETVANIFMKNQLLMKHDQIGKLTVPYEKIIDNNNWWVDFWHFCRMLGKDFLSTHQSINCDHNIFSWKITRRLFFHFNRAFLTYYSRVVEILTLLIITSSTVRTVIVILKKSLTYCTYGTVPYRFYYNCIIRWYPWNDVDKVRYVRMNIPFW